jgi:hypothetical protein
MAGWAGELVTEKPATVAPSQASARLAVEHSRERHTPWIRSRDEIRISQFLWNGLVRTCL